MRREKEGTFFLRERMGEAVLEDFQVSKACSGITSRAGCPKLCGKRVSIGGFREPINPGK